MNESPYERAIARTAGDPGKVWRIVSREELRQTLEKAMDEVLLPREKMVLYLRYGCWDGYEHTIVEISRMLKISKRRASSISRNALKKLKRSKYSALVVHLEGHHLFKKDPASEFTPMEKKVLFLVGKGLDNGEIASVLFISENTVRSHLKSIYSKAGLKSRVKLALFALKFKVDQ